VIASPKGWYDAGDYGKYTVNAGITTYTLLSLYEHFPKYFKALKWNIPADGNLLDLLAEIKYNLDWMLTMQAKDGGVYHKLSGLDFPSTVMPAKDDSGARYIIGKSVTATYDFAGVMAAAARVYKDYNASYASKCLAAAESAFRWAENHPGSLYLANPKSVKTGAYEDSDASDEAQFAATELYVSTGNPAYKKEGSSGNVPSWQNVYGLATYAKSIYKVDFGTGAYTDLIATADRMVQYASKGFGVPMQSSDFVWGSNSVAANQGVWLLQAYYLTGKKEYYNTAVRALDYLVGKNPLGMSYVTGIGTNSPQNPHHRISQADGVKTPVPGMLVGGPQKKDNSDVSTNCSYSRTYPATAYYDNSCSYATNEVAINWNAPLAYLAGALEALATGEAPTFAEIPVYTGSSSSVASSSSVVQSSSSQVKSSSSVASSSSSVKSSSSVASSSSSEAKSSSSSAKSESSSSEAKSSSSSEAESSSSEHTTVAWNDVQPTFNLAVNGMTLTLTNTQGGVVRIFDALGHLVAAKPLAGTTTSITLQTPGNYIVRVNGMSEAVNLK
jgi:endoglucanase